MSACGRRDARGWARCAVAELTPGSFAFVMATGIVSIAASSLHLDTAAWTLFQINKGAYAALALLTAARIAWYWPRVVRDLTDHARAAGSLAVVAGTCVLGSQYTDIAHDARTAVGLWGLGVCLWLVLCYGFFAAATVRQAKPGLDAALNGSWLLIVVATQSVSLLGTGVAPALGPWGPPALLVSLGLFLVGSLLYVVLIVLIFYRFLFVRMVPDALTPLYWINMGALAITTFAGASLIERAGAWRFLQSLAPFLDGFTTLFWAMATWWVPQLLILGVWRHLVQRVSLRYDPEYWGIVFPLGMYTRGTLAFAQATGLTFLNAIPHLCVYVALGAWVATSLGLVARWGRRLADDVWGDHAADAAARLR